MCLSSVSVIVVYSCTLFVYLCVSIISVCVRTCVCVCVFCCSTYFVKPLFLIKSATLISYVVIFVCFFITFLLLLFIYFEGLQFCKPTEKTLLFFNCKYVGNTSPFLEVRLPNRHDTFFRLYVFEVEVPLPDWSTWLHFIEWTNLPYHIL